MASRTIGSLRSAPPGFRRVIALLLLGFSLGVVGCSPDSSDGDGILLARPWEPADEPRIVAMGLDGTEIGTIEMPSGFTLGLEIVSVSSPGSDMALVISGGNLLLLDKSDLTLTHAGSVEQFRWHEYGSRFVVLEARGAYSVLDLADGRRHEIASGDELIGVAASGDRIAVSLLNGVDTVTTVLDVATGRITSLPAGGRLDTNAFDDAGERLLIVRNNGGVVAGPTQFAVSDVANPGDPRVWFENESGASAVWAGEKLVVVEYATGSVRVVGVASDDSIGVLPDVDGEPVALISDPGSGVVLASVAQDGGWRWHRIDPSRGTITEVTRAAGLFPGGLRVPRVPGYQAVSDVAPDSLEGTYTGMIRIADGQIVDLVSSDERNMRGLMERIGGAVVMISDPVDRSPLRIVDLESAASVEVGDAFRALLSPDEKTAAVVQSTTAGPRTVLVDVASGEIGAELPGGLYFAWLD
jgi:hypothetical protein